MFECEAFYNSPRRWARWSKNFDANDLSRKFLMGLRKENRDGTHLAPPFRDPVSPMLLV